MENPCISTCQFSGDMRVSCWRSRDGMHKWKRMKRPEKWQRFFTPSRAQRLGR
ncbi:DUF1289 domain-containing protein [Pseudomonas fluorescens]|nr:DUF1289 domain-containing protein [Pseudomonas fluorescens]